MGAELSITPCDSGAVASNRLPALSGALMALQSGAQNIDRKPGRLPVIQKDVGPDRALRFTEMGRRLRSIGRRWRSINRRLERNDFKRCTRWAAAFPAWNVAATDVQSKK